MRINPIVAGAIVTAMFAIQAWTLTEVINLKVKFAVVEERLHINDQWNNGAVGMNRNYSKP